MINNTFHPIRFSRYLNKIWVEQWRNNFMRAIILLAFCIVSVFLIAATSYEYYFKHTDYTPTEDAALDAEGLFFTFVFVICGGIAASNFMANLGKKSERISALTLPVTSFEMFIARWLMSVPLYIATFLVCFHIADALRLAIFSMLLPDYPFAVFNVFALGEWTMAWYSLALIYFATSSVYILGAVFFIKQSFLKTSVALCILLVVFLAGLFLVHYSSSSAFTRTSFVPLTIGQWLFSCCTLGLAYVRVKELNVINRL